MMTERDAQERWCPFAWQLGLIKSAAREPIAMAAANRTHEGDLLGLCAASQCMACRWDRNSSEATGAYARSGLGAALNADPTPKRGYCGLAGRPA